MVPVRLSAGRLTELASEPLPELRPRALLRIDLRIGAEERLGRAQLQGALVDLEAGVRHEGRPSLVPAEDLRGSLALAVQGTTVWITSLEVRGALDPRSLGEE